MREEKSYQTLDISSRFKVEVSHPRLFSRLSDAKRKLIDAIWEKEQKRRGGLLHEGVIFSVDSMDKKGLKGSFVPYKYYLAQLCDPSLKADLKITPASVTGITYSQDHVILAKRAFWVAEAPGSYELAPSGGIQKPEDGSEKINIREQLLKELFEEIGVRKSSVQTLKFFALVHDLENDAVELVAKVFLKPSVLYSTTPEYTQIFSVPITELQEFASKRKGEILPLSLFLLRFLKLVQ